MQWLIQLTQWSHIQQMLVGAVMTAFVLWLGLPLAFRFKLLDIPQGRKWHVGPTPSIGGIGMAIGALLTGLLTVDVLGRPFQAFAAGGIVLIVVGVLDDRYDLSWYWRVLMQALASLIMVYYGGVRIEHLGPVFGMADVSIGALSVPFTVFATVGLINAVNMVDGADGLAGLLVAAALAMQVAAASYSGNTVLLPAGEILLGSVLGFLAYNLRFPWQPRARLFMGNSGSAFLGFAIAWMTFGMTQNATYPVSPVLALWLIPIPVMDTLVLLVRRVRKGMSPFDADRNHIHHLMQDAGFGPTQAAVAMTLFTLVCGLLAGQCMRAGVPDVVILTAYVAMCLGWYWLTARRRRAIAVLRAAYAPSSVATAGAQALASHAHATRVQVFPPDLDNAHSDWSQTGARATGSGN